MQLGRFPSTNVVWERVVLKEELEDGTEDESEKGVVVKLAFRIQQYVR